MGAQSSNPNLAENPAFTLHLHCQAGSQGNCHQPFTPSLSTVICTWKATFIAPGKQRLFVPRAPGFSPELWKAPPLLSWPRPQALLC